MLRSLARPLASRCHPPRKRQARTRRYEQPFLWVPETIYNTLRAFVAELRSSMEARIRELLRILVLALNQTDHPPPPALRRPAVPECSAHRQTWRAVSRHPGG